MALGVIFAWYSMARILEIFSGSIPQTAIVALDVLGALAFALVDGGRVAMGCAGLWCLPEFAWWWGMWWRTWAW